MTNIVCRAFVDSTTTYVTLRQLCIAGLFTPRVTVRIIIAMAAVGGVRLCAFQYLPGDMVDTWMNHLKEVANIGPTCKPKAI